MLSLTVDNIKCGGCAHQIEKQLRQQANVQDVTIEVDTGEITIKGDVQEPDMVDLLRKMGYPLTGTGTAINTAKSFVSCMIGRVDKATS